MSNEQRHFPRTTLSEETIYFSRENNEPGNEPIYSPAIITDISQGGLGMQVGIAHEINDELWFEGIEGLNGMQSARVVWINDTESQEVFSIGVAFKTHAA